MDLWTDDSQARLAEANHVPAGRKPQGRTRLRRIALHEELLDVKLITLRVDHDRDRSAKTMLESTMRARPHGTYSHQRSSEREFPTHGNSQGGPDSRVRTRPEAHRQALH
jgi:hypothetical protein